MSRTRVLLADDHALVRSGLRALLEAQPDLQVVGEVEDGAAVVAACRKLQPDVVVMDLTMPGRGGINATEDLRQECPETKVVVLTMHDDEAYMRLARLAEKFGLPVVTLVDTGGAYPGKDAEEGGQAGAIARSIEAFANLAVPTVTVVIGEGGSGGALALAVADRVMMLENSVYSVISPEGCAALVWRDAAEAARAAEALRLTARDLLDLGLIDRVIPEPTGGAHLDHRVTAKRVMREVQLALGELERLQPAERLRLRRAKYLKMGSFLVSE